jgi:hypothetical protein
LIARVVMLAIPAVAITLTAAVLLGPGATRPALGARIYGATAPAPAKVALRVLTMTSLYGVEEVAGVGDVLLDEDGHEVWSGVITKAGVGDPSFTPRSSQPEIAIRLDQRVLVHGKLDLSKPHPLAIEGVRSLEGPTRGELQVQVSAKVSPFAVSFPGVLFVDVNEPGGEPIAAEVKISAPGATITETLSKELRKTYAILPQFHVVNIEVDATANDKTGHWEGSLPIVPGAMSLEETSDHRQRVVAPVLRERAFLSFWSRDGRIAGGSVPLYVAENGQTVSGPFDIARWASGAVAVTISSDPLEQSIGTMTWPLESGSATPPELELLLDGMPRSSLGPARARGGGDRRDLFGVGAKSESASCPRRTPRRGQR